MWKIVRHDCKDNLWTTLSVSETICSLNAANSTEHDYVIWDAPFPQDAEERNNIINTMFNENGDRLHSIYIGARIEPMFKDPPIIKDPLDWQCGGTYCFCVREAYQKNGKCLTSYPMVDGSFNIQCDGGHECR